MLSLPALAAFSERHRAFGGLPVPSELLKEKIGQRAMLGIVARRASGRSMNTNPRGSAAGRE
jgi:hypothetical protein